MVPRRWTCLVALVVVFLGIAAGDIAQGADPAGPKRVLLLGQGPDGHPFASHEYLTGLSVVKKCLDRVEGLEAAIVEADEPFRAGPELIDRADGVVLYLSEGAKWVQQDEARVAALERLAARGGGLTCLHWAMGCRDEKYIEKYVALLGGCHGGPDRKYAVVTATTEIAAAQHPVMTHVAPVTVEDEFYYRLKFVKPEESLTPLLRVTIEGESYPVSWAWERPNAGRSFGFSGLHFHKNWQHEAYRRLVVQGIVWTVKLKIPAEGLNVDVTENDLRLPAKKK